MWLGHFSFPSEPAWPIEPVQQRSTLNTCRCTNVEGWKVSCFCDSDLLVRCGHAALGSRISGRRSSNWAGSVTGTIASVGPCILSGIAGRLNQPIKLAELSASRWVVNPVGCPTRQMLEAAPLQQGLPLETAVEAEGYALQFSLISDGVGVGSRANRCFSRISATQEYEDHQAERLFPTGKNLAAVLQIYRLPFAVSEMPFSRI
jgi:hypothetical protein